MSAKPLSDASKQVLAVWFLGCAAVPFGVLVPTAERSAGLVAAAAALAALGVAVGVAYAWRWRPAWHLLQVCLLAAAGLAGYWGNRWLFVGASALMIYLYFLLYAPQVREEFDIHTAPREVGVLLVLLGMCAVLAILRPGFLEGGNLLDLARQFATVGIMAVGMTMVIVLGGIDLSVGSIVAISGCLATLALRHHDSSLAMAVGISVAAGLVVGLFNGALISGFRMAPFVVTLGTMSMARSLAIVVTGAKQVPVKGCSAEAGFHALAWADTLGVPNPVWLMTLMVLAGHVFLCYTRTGRHIYYIGANEEAARLSGIHVTAIKGVVYTLCGLLAGLAGIVQASRIATGQPSAGAGDELRVIAAVIIGGASFSGGVGTALGSLLGAAIMGVLRQGLILLGVEPNWQQFVEGAVIIGAVGLDLLRKRR
ncbi:MAG TPA: ABC transporter permease [Planctomycetota bacterium]|nr:ABC transporter permease [Planctomycetota bacterium]HRR82781.1 ABC transporter permease [Planctomycetota bacterium]HRT96168.1 ABC transporter permease [Planctomycetota bacterium]